MMRVLMIGNDPSVKGGITSVITRLLDHDWHSDGVELRFLPTYIEASRIRQMLFYGRAWWQIRQEILTNCPDVVHIHMSYKGSFYRAYGIHRLLQAHGVPDVLHLHGSEFRRWYEGAGTRTQSQVRALLKECSACITLGDRWNQAVLGIEPEAHTVVISNAVPMPDVRAVWRQDPFQVLFLGVLIRRKGVHDLLRAVQYLRERGEAGSLRFMIAGTGAEEARLQELAAAYGVNDLMTFAGWTDGECKTQLLRESQMLVLPSYNEGLPMAVLEALSYGLPVVATDVGDMAAAVRNDVDGYLVQPGDVETLAAAIHKVSSDEQVYNRLSRGAVEVAGNEFGEHKYYKRILQCYLQAYRK